MQTVLHTESKNKSVTWPWTLSEKEKQNNTFLNTVNNPTKKNQLIINRALVVLKMFLKVANNSTENTEQ